jgi:hypothetical protein
MAYTPADARENMVRLIAGLKTQHEHLSNMLDGTFSASKIAEINNLRMKVSIEIHHREALAAFDAASKQIVREPTPQEVSALQDTLRMLDQDLSGLANFQAVVSFIEDVMTKNAERFVEIIKTIRTNA